MTEAPQDVSLDLLKELDSWRDIVSQVQKIGENEKEDLTLVVLASAREMFKGQLDYFRPSIAVRSDIEFSHSNQMIKFGQHVNSGEYKVVDLLRFDTQEDFDVFLSSHHLDSFTGITGLLRQSK